MLVVTTLSVFVCVCVCVFDIQVVHFKQEHPELLLMVEVGYRFRFFGVRMEARHRGGGVEWSRVALNSECVFCLILIIYLLCVCVFVCFAFCLLISRAQLSSGLSGRRKHCRTSAEDLAL